MKKKNKKLDLNKEIETSSRTKLIACHAKI